MKSKTYYGNFRSLAEQINADQAGLRVDCHFNSNSLETNYSQVGIRKGDIESAEIGRALVNKTAHKLGIQNNQIKELSPGQRGYPIVRDTNCPTLLWEPCFCSNSAGAEVIKLKRRLLHEAFMETIHDHIGSNKLVALVAGHAHKMTGDSGAVVYGGGTEAKYAEILAQELSSLINNTSQREDDMPAFQAVPSKKTDTEVWYDGLFTGIGDWGRGRVFIIVRVDPDNTGATFKYIVIPKDRNKFPTLKWSDPIAMKPDNRPVEIEFPQDIGNFSLHVKSENNPILTAVNQMYKARDATKE